MRLALSLFLLFLGRGGRRSCSGANEDLKFGHKFRYVSEFEVNGRKSNVGDLVEGLQASHYNFADLAGDQFAIERILYILFNLIDDLFELNSRNRAFLSSSEQSGEHFIAVKLFTFAVLFDDHIWDLVNAFVRRKTPSAAQALTAAPDGIAILRLARIDDLIFNVCTKWTTHKKVSCE